MQSMKSRKRRKKGDDPFYPDCPPGSPYCISVTDTFLVDTTTNTRLLAIKPGDFLDYGLLASQFGTTNLSIECATSGMVGSMILTDNFGARTIDNNVPFVLEGSSNRGYLGSIVQEDPAIWTFFCQPYYGENAKKEAGAPRLTSVVIERGDPLPTPSPTNSPIEDCNVCQAGCIDIVDFVLVNVESGTPVRSIADGATIPIVATNQYTVECITDPDPSSTLPFAIGSVLLMNNRQTPSGVGRNSPPFALHTDGSGGYAATNFFDNPGPWEVSCTAFCDPNGSGASSPTRSITFNVLPFGPPAPGVVPTQIPTQVPTLSNVPTLPPTIDATTIQVPTSSPTEGPTVSQRPTGLTLSPTTSQAPSIAPSPAPSPSPSSAPSLSRFPTNLPTSLPSNSQVPSNTPTSVPSVSPTMSPSKFPSGSPSDSPTEQPSSIPTGVPSGIPTRRPSFQPTFGPTSPPTISSKPTISSMPSFDCTGGCKAGCLVVEGYDLVNVADPSDRRRIVEGETIEVTDSDTYELECIVRQYSFSVGGTVLSDNREVERVNENLLPYTLNGGGSSLFDFPGLWIVNCQAFCERNGRGEAGELYTVTFLSEPVEASNILGPVPAGTSNTTDSGSLDTNNVSVPSPVETSNTTDPEPVKYVSAPGPGSPDRPLRNPFQMMNVVVMNVNMDGTRRRQMMRRR